VRERRSRGGRGGEGEWGGGGGDQVDRVAVKFIMIELRKEERAGLLWEVAYTYAYIYTHIFCSVEKKKNLRYIYIEKLFSRAALGCGRYICII
jgi:hypothetical protein